MALKTSFTFDNILSFLSKTGSAEISTRLSSFILELATSFIE